MTMKGIAIITASLTAAGSPFSGCFERAYCGRQQHDRLAHYRSL